MFVHAIDGVGAVIVAITEVLFVNAPVTVLADVALTFGTCDATFKSDERFSFFTLTFTSHPLLMYVCVCGAFRYTRA